MTAVTKASARAVADVEKGVVLARVEIAVPPERVFRALTTDEITRWWGADDMYRTTRYEADLRVGGRWRSEGKGNDGSPFHVEGEFLEISPPHKLVQTWKPSWEAGPATTVSYRLEATPTGTKVTVRHTGFEASQAASCEGHADGWTRVFGWLEGWLNAQSASAASDGKFFLIRLIAPRPSFMMDMNADERAAMMAHAGYWAERLKEGVAVVFGPVADPKGGWGMGVVKVKDEAELRAFEAKDPAIASKLGLRYEVLPMLQAVYRA